jgi:hypothetical protein
VVELAVTDALIDEYMTQAFNYFSFSSSFPVHSNEPFKRSVRVVQVVWRDSEGLYPDDQGYNHAGFPQLTLETNNVH